MIPAIPRQLGELRHLPAPLLEPIGDENLQEYCEFLHEYLNRDITVDRWVFAFRQDWGVNNPNHGFMIRDNVGRVVGGIGAIYAKRTIRGRPESFCNITSWCVLEPYRSHSLRLAVALVSQPGFHFTDLTPTPVVAGSLHFLKFKSMDGRVTVMPNLPWWTPGVDVVTDPAAIERVLSPEHARVYRDHRQFPWLWHVAVGRRQTYCHVAYKKEALKHLPCAAVVYMSDPALFLRYHSTFGRHVLLRHAMASTRVESRLLPRAPLISGQVPGYYAKVFRSDTLHESDISNFYSEVVALNL